MRPRPLYFTRRALEAMARGPYVALVGTATVFVALLAIGVLAAALGGAERLLTAWAGEVRISAYLAPGADLEAARAAAAAAAPGRAVRAVTAGGALRRLAADSGSRGGCSRAWARASSPTPSRSRRPASRSPRRAPSRRGSARSPAWRRSTTAPPGWRGSSAP